MQNAKCENAKCKMQNVKCEIFLCPSIFFNLPLPSFKKHVPIWFFQFFFVTLQC